MKKFIPITVGNYLVVHGYDEHNREIIESIEVERASLKIVAVDRIQSLSEKYMLVTGAFGRLMYWEYEESFEEISAKLMEN